MIVKYPPNGSFFFYRSDTHISRVIGRNRITGVRGSNGRGNRVKKHDLAGFALLTWLIVVAAAPWASAGDRSGRNGLTQSAGDTQQATRGQIQWTHYETTQPSTICSSTSAPASCKSGGAGDSILRLVNPNGAANPSFLRNSEHTVCAMIYVFDNNQEMGECCGCPLSSAKLTSFSVEHNLLSNFVLGGENDFGNGAIAIVAADQNTTLIAFPPADTNGQGCIANESGACNFGCDPTNFPGYAVTTDTNLLGSMMHDQYVESNSGSTVGLTETSLFDDGRGDAANLMYLQVQCGVLVGNSSGRGTCNCPLEPNLAG